MATIASSPAARSARLGLRATPEQEAVLRRAAEVAHKSLTDFVLDSACLAAEQTLLDVSKRFPYHLSAQIHLAVTYLTQGNRTAAYESLIQVQTADPNGAYGQMAGEMLKQYFP